MIWSKIPSPAPAATATNPPTAAPCPETRITAIGLVCSAGDQPFALLGAVGTSLSAAAPDPVLSFPVPGKDEEACALSAPVPGLEEIPHPAERMEILAVTALGHALDQVSGELATGKTLVLTLLPAKRSPRGGAFNPQALEVSVKTQLPMLQAAQFRFVEAESGAVAALLQACRELAARSWNRVIFGGVDSLVDPVSCTELALAGRLMTVGGVEGLVPGEGAAYLVLQAADKAGTKPPGTTLARILGAAQTTEPHAGQADSKPMTGLAAAIRQSLPQSQGSAQQLAGIILPLGAETASALEWYQTTEQLWPTRPQQQPTTTTPREEWPLHLALGELGAATLPFALALACARFDFEHPPLETILACEAGDGPARGAVLLQAGN